MPLANRNFSDLITFTRASGGGRFNASGQYEWLPANTPRIDYDPVTGECRGLLIEEQRTNLLTYSSDFANAVWVKRGTFSVTPNAAISPDGTANATLVTGLNSGTNDMYRQGINSGGLAAEARYEPSVYVKKVTQTGTVNISNSYTPSYGDWTVDLSKIGDGWERITRSHPAVTVVVEFKIHTTGYLGIQLRKTTIGEVSLYIWGAQLEAGSPSSYIPTTDAQVTRAADIPTVNTLSPWFSASQGTLFMEASTPHAVPSNQFPRVAWMGAADNSEYLQVGYLTETAAGVFAKRAGVTMLDMYPSASGRTRKIAISFDGASLAASANGAAVSSSALAGGDFSSFGLLALGRRGSTNNLFLNGHIRSFRFYPRAYEGEVLQYLSLHGRLPAEVAA